MKAILTIFLRAFLLAAVFAGNPAFAQKKKEQPVIKAPPPPIPRKVILDRGQQVTVPLAVYGSGVENMEFVIRTAPKFGKLSAVQITGNSTAAVIYTVPEDTIDFEDRFAYAVKTADGVSAPAIVTISIAEPSGIPPRLVVPASLEMEAIHPGESATILVPIKNAGGGFAEGELNVSEPWKVEGSPKFRLGGGAKMDFKVSFSSTKIGPRKTELTYGERHRSSTTLNVNVLPAFTITPALLELKPKPGTTTRTGQVRITNGGTEPQMITIKHGGKLLTETSITVPGRQSHNLAVFAEPSEIGTIEDVLKLRSGEWFSDLPVIARPLGPMVSCKEKAVEFGDVITERIALREVTVENTGGTAIALTFNVTGPFRTEPTSVALKPKSSVKVTVICKAETPGAATGTLTIAGEGTQNELPLSANAKAPAPKPRTVAVAAAAPLPAVPDEPALVVARAKVASALVPPATAVEIPNLVGRPRQGTPTSAIFEWTSVPKQNLSAQQRILTASASGPVINWKDIKAKFTQQGALMLCELESLTPQTHYTIRALAGTATECTVSFITPTKPPFPITLRSVLLTIMVAAAGWMLWKRWKTSARSGW